MNIHNVAKANLHLLINPRSEDRGNVLEASESTLGQKIEAMY